MRLVSVRTALKTRVPTMYWKGRNTFALGEWYWHRFSSRFTGREAIDPYDDQFWDLHNSGDWEGVARLLLSWFRPTSVMDIGCGDGKLIGALRQVDPRLRVHGFDSSTTALNRAKAAGLEVSYLDLMKCRVSDVDSLYNDVGPFDLAICMEVIEHIPGWHANKLLRLLSHCEMIVFSAAHPLQGGTLHVNERPAAYWIAKFNRLGFDLSEENDRFRSEFRSINVPPWYSQNVQLLRERHVEVPHVLREASPFDG